MSGFSADWLALREPLDAASRAAPLTVAFATALRARAGERPLEWVDLGAGTGANCRYLAPLAGGAQRWLLLDDDRRLLDAVAERTARWAATIGARCERRGDRTLAVARGTLECRVETKTFDLAGDAAALPLRDGVVVTASALLDLVSEPWLHTLADRCRAAAAPSLFALTYDGRMECRPVDSTDARIAQLFNAHQLRDKGFGPALGPNAAATAARLFAARGYRVTTARSDWRLGPAQAALQAALIAGWHDAALEMAPDDARAIAEWRTRRLDASRAGALELVVGHVDLALWPALDQ